MDVGQLLTHHFLADGIYQPAYVFTCLPLCFANAMANRSIGLSRFLPVLVQLPAGQAPEKRLDVVGSPR